MTAPPPPPPPGPQGGEGPQWQQPAPGPGYPPAGPGGYPGEGYPQQEVYPGGGYPQQEVYPGGAPGYDPNYGGGYPPGYGGYGGKPPLSQRKGLLIGIGAGVVGVIALVLILVLVVFSGDDNSPVGPGGTTGGGGITQAELQQGIDECVNSGGPQAICESVMRCLAGKLTRTEFGEIAQAGNLQGLPSDLQAKVNSCVPGGGSNG